MRTTAVGATVAVSVTVILAWWIRVPAWLYAHRLGRVNSFGYVSAHLFSACRGARGP